jgi:hypothetical protein
LEGRTVRKVALGFTLLGIWLIAAPFLASRERREPVPSLEPDEPVDVRELVEIDGSSIDSGCWTSCGRRNLVSRSSCCRSAPSDLDIGLQWLARHQAFDGHWSSSAFGDCCHGKRCTGGTFFLDDERTTALALLPFLGAGFTPQTRQWFVDRVDGQKRYHGVVVRRAIAWLIAREDHESGAFGPRDADLIPRQALATLALNEAYGATNAVSYRGAAQKATRFLEGLRKRDGSFGGSTRRALLALKSAQDSGLDVTTPIPKGFKRSYADIDEGLATSVKEIELIMADQHGPVSGCAFGSFDGRDGRVCETARTLIRYELAYRYELVGR